MEIPGLMENDMDDTMFRCEKCGRILPKTIKNAIMPDNLVADEMDNYVLMMALNPWEEVYVCRGCYYEMRQNSVWAALD